MHYINSMVASVSCHKSWYSTCACMHACMCLCLCLWTTHLSNKLWVLPVSDVILADITMQPVAEIQEAIIQGEKNICDQTYREGKDKRA